MVHKKYADKYAMVFPVLLTNSYSKPDYIFNFRLIYFIALRI